MCPVIGHSVITVSKSLLLYETSSIPVGLHIAAETTSVPCLLVSKKKGEKDGQREKHSEREEDECVMHAGEGP